MKITDIENMSFADLKAKRADLVEAAKKVEPEVLAARYVQARTDATMRDEKMAAQGETITALQEEARSSKIAAVNAEQARKTAVARADKIAKECVPMKEVKKVARQLHAMTQRAQAAEARAAELQASIAKQTARK